MIERIKQWLWVIPAAVLGYIYFLTQKVAGLQAQLGRAKAEAQLADTMAKVAETKKEADRAEDDYDAAVTKYRSERDDSGR